MNVRYPREIRDSLQRLRELPFVTDKGATVLLQDVARVSIEEGPPMLRSENARLSGWVYVDVRGRDLRSVVNDMQAAVAKQVALPAGYAVSWSGQFEYLERATERLKLVVPVTLAVIFVLLYLLFRSFGDAALVMAAVPFSLVGGFWLVWALGHSVSVATAVGFIALAGVAAEFGVVMLVYLKNALRAATRGRRAGRRDDAAGRDSRGRGAARASEGDDGGRRHGRAAADHVGQRHRFGGDDAHRRADGRRHGHGAAAEHARRSGGRW